MKWKTKVGLGGLLVLGVALGSLRARDFDSREEAMGYHGARVAMLIVGPWLIVAGLLQRRRELVGASKPSPARRTPDPPPVQPRPSIEPPKQESRDPRDGPKLLG